MQYQYHKLQPWLRHALANPPKAGAGIHAFLFSMARQLHAHFSPAGVEEALTTATAQCGRHVTAREIRDAVANSREVAWQPTTSKAHQVRGGNVPKAGAGRVVQPAAPDLMRWPAVDLDARCCRIAEGRRDSIGSVAELWTESESSCILESVDDWLDRLFPGAEWLCLATDHPDTARSRPLHRWYFGPAEKCGLVVPSPMTGPSGKNKEGYLSHRCLENTGPRRWLVIEFDPKKWEQLTPQEKDRWGSESKYDSAMLDDQAALHWHLDRAAAAMGWPRLCLVVHSAGKSLHGWFGPKPTEESAEALMMYARILGADTATWVRCQLVRLPGGTRGGRKQEVHFWRSPETLLANSTGNPL